MIAYLSQFNPVVQALMATLFTWGLTALGAGIVVFTKRVSPLLMDISLGFAGGVMIAASFWSLLAPSIDMAEDAGMTPWLPAAVGFLGGALFMRLVDMILPHLHLGLPTSEAEGPKTSWQRSTLLVLAITLHNIPEGLAVGVAFGAVASRRRVGHHRCSSCPGHRYRPAEFSRGNGGVTAAETGGHVQAQSPVVWSVVRHGGTGGRCPWGRLRSCFFIPMLPYALAFAAGAMIFVVIEEVIPESQRGSNGDMASIGTVLGFTTMMILDVALG
jgi:ZIP family zinc transporter